VSEFYPSTTCSFYEEHPEFDDYDEVSDPTGPVATGIPISILQNTVTQYLPSENRYTKITSLAGRIRGHVDVRINYIIEDERTGERYMIESLDKPHNPVGDASWRIQLRRIG